MRYLCVFISLVIFNQNSYAEVTICSGKLMPCAFEGNVTDLNKTNLEMELLINITNSLDGKCSVPLNRNISLTVPKNENIKTGDDVKFSASSVCMTVIKEGK